MSSKNKKQGPRRLRPVKPIIPGTQGHRNARSRPGRVFIGIALALGAMVVVYAVTRPKASAPPAAVPAASRPPVRPQPITPPPPLFGPRFEVTGNSYDFGRVEGNQMVDCLVVFTNNGTEPMEVTQVSSGCSCMKIGEWTGRIEPGQTGTFEVRVDTAQYTGPFAKSVFVASNDPGQPNARVEIKGYVWRPLEITPRAAVLNLSSENPSNSVSVRVLSYLDEPMYLSELQSTLPNLAVELRTNQLGKDYYIDARTIPPYPTSRQQGRISFNTSTDRVPSTNIQVSLNYQPVLQALPNQLRLPPAPLTQPVSLQAWVRNNGTNPLVISSAAVNLPGVDVTMKDDPMNRGQNLTLSFPAGFEAPAGTNIELVVRTTHPDYSELRLPILQPRP